MKKIIKFWIILITLPSLTNAFEFSKKEKIAKKEGHKFMFLPIIDPSTGPTRSTTGYGFAFTWCYLRDGDQIDSKSFYSHSLTATALWRKVGSQNYEIMWDAPYLAGSNFSLTSKISYEYDTSAIFWGSNYSDQSYLRGPAGSTVEGKKFNFEDYQEELSKKSNSRFKYYNYYESKVPSFEAFLVYHFPFKLKSLFGFQVSYITIHDFGKEEGAGISYGDKDYITLLNREKNDVIGYKGGSANSITIGGAWDTRDSQIDPLWGGLSELTFEIFPRVINKQTDFAKMTLSQSIFLSPIQWVTFASRFIYGHASEKTPFWSLSEIPIGKTAINGLGGFDSLRGYTSKRFVAPIQMLGNFELRLRIPTFKIWILPLSLFITPFFDVGRVFDEFYDISFKDWKFNYGGMLGFRIKAITLSVGLSYSEEVYNRLLIDFSHMF